MTKYKLSNTAKDDLVRIHHYGTKTFGVKQADDYFDSFFNYFDIIALRPFSFLQVLYLYLEWYKGYR